MIKYNLKCDNSHEFESWFSSSNEFEKLKTKKLIECIYCNSKKIDKSIMSPLVLNKDIKNQEKNKFITDTNKIRKELFKVRKFIEKNFEYVGNDFSKEVRNIYYDKRKNKKIYGNATDDETAELKKKVLK